MATHQADMTMSISGGLVKNATKSFPMSKRFTKIVVNCTIFNILAQRMVVSSSELKRKEFNNVPFFVFKKPRNVKDRVLKQMLKWMDGIKEAIEKNYLKNIFLFMKDANDDILESYKFSLKYNLEQENNVYRPKIGDVEDEITGLFELLQKLGEYPKLHENVTVEVEFMYNDCTPQAYQPPGFIESKEPACLKYQDAFSQCLATLNTGYHKINLIANDINPLVAENIPKTEIKTLANDETLSQSQVANNKSLDGMETCDNNATEKQVSSPTKKILNCSEVSAGEKDISSTKIIKMNCSVISAEEKDMSSTKMINMSCSEASVADSVVSVSSEENENFPRNACVCHLNFEIPAHLIECSQCKKCVHGPCYGFMDDMVVQNFRCVSCKTTDSKLKMLNTKEQQMLGVTRLLFYFLKKENKLSKESLDSPEKTLLTIFEKVQKCNIILSDGSLNQEALNSFINDFFAGVDSQFFD